MTDELKTSPETEEKKNPSRQADVFFSLKRDIVFGRLRANERLPEEELAVRFGVGRYVIRAALEELDRCGLIKKRPNRGAVVIAYTDGEIEELYDMRELLHRQAVERMPLPAPRSLVSELHAINDEYGVYLDKGDIDRVAEVNDAFHMTLFEACGNRYLASTIEEYWQKTAAIHCYAIGDPNLARHSHHEHRQMIEALASGDRILLADLTVRHMWPALEAYRAAHAATRRRAGIRSTAQQV